MGPHESFRISSIGLGEDVLPAPNYLLSPAVMQHFRCQQTDAAVMVLDVVPGEEVLAEAPGILDAAKAIRKLRPVLFVLN